MFVTPAMNFKTGKVLQMTHCAGSTRIQLNWKHLWHCHQDKKITLASFFLRANVQTMSRDMMKLQLSQQFCRTAKIFCHATWVSCRVGVTLCGGFCAFRGCNTCTFGLTIFAVLRHRTKFFAVIRYIIMGHLFYEAAWSGVFWGHGDDVASLVRVRRGCSPAARGLHPKFGWACDVVFVVSG